MDHSSNQFQYLLHQSLFWPSLYILVQLRGKYQRKCKRPLSLAQCIKQTVNSGTSQKYVLYFSEILLQCHAILLKDSYKVTPSLHKENGRDRSCKIVFLNIFLLCSLHFALSLGRHIAHLVMQKEGYFSSLKSRYSMVGNFRSG